MRRYFYLNLPQHLAEAGERRRLDALLTNPAWLKAKLEATGNPAAMVSDYEQYANSELQQYIGRTLRLTSGICARDRRQLIPQFLGRFSRGKAAKTRDFLAAARGQLSPPSLVPVLNTFTPPGAEIARLEGHTSSVTALCLLPDGILASGSDDSTHQPVGPQHRRRNRQTARSYQLGQHALPVAGWPSSLWVRG